MYCLWLQYYAASSLFIYNGSLDLGASFYLLTFIQSDISYFIADLPGSDQIVPWE